MPETYSPHNFKLEVATFVNNEGEGYDIIAPNVMLGFKIHESITSNFLMGEVVIADSLGILEHGKLFGQESIRLRFQQPQGFGCLLYTSPSPRDATLSRMPASA